MKKKTRLILLTIIGALIVLLVALGLSYAYMHNSVGAGSHSKLGANSCAKILLMEKSNSINITNSYPMSENAALNTDPYSFGVRSTCSGNRGFKLYIVTIAGNTLSANNIRFALTPKGEKEILTSGIVGQLSSGSSDYIATQTTQLQNSVGTVDSIYYVYENNLIIGEATYYDLYMWVDGDATTSVANKSFTAAVAILEGEYIDTDIAIRLAGNINTYDADVTCTGTSDAGWNPLTRQVEVFDITQKPTNCTVRTKANTNLGNLKNIVEAANDVYEETGTGDLTNIAQNKYTMPTPFYTTSWSTTVTSGTNEATAISWDSTNNYWVTNPAEVDKYYYFLITVEEAGYYQLCYKKLSGGTSNQLYEYKNNISMVIGGGSYDTAYSATDICLDFGYVETTDTIRIGQRTYSEVSSLALYLKKAETIVSAGYRYEGHDPNNYVWFNNENWRIIGSIPTKIDSGGSTTTTNLVKIIRNQSIGGLVWNKTTPRPDWNASTLYTLLNSYYYGAENATGNTYCYGNASSAKAKCDYRDIGIKPTSYYGSMIKEVYWSTGLSDSNITPSIIYANEVATQTMKGYIGIISVSDYGFASTYNRPIRIPMHTNVTTEATVDWLYGQGYEWTITPVVTDNSLSFSVYEDGKIASASTVRYGYIVRPVVYLDSSVYVVSGDGSVLNPYKLGM